jgi:hypothetical protein
LARALKDERQQTEMALTQLDYQQRERIGIDLNEACAILDGFPTSQSPSPRRPRATPPRL